MDNHTELQSNGTINVMSFLGGLLVGSLAGGTAMLLLAPQSGKRTRTKIIQKSIELHDQTNDTVKDALAQTHHKARQIKTSVKNQAEAVQQRGQDIVDEQKERFSTLVEASNKAIQGVLG